uniref:Uncharacterized protein n=1 Tax=Utricularia reniformis TaxID=192314 RepID=A0A1Y0AZS9_9LAMI|nr:hypothetical protein AEK19_MT0372 [Utricularia reniformis]ART30644.1 hypothetical protein AEK19_MT0372 [Utricularia reniformis]
MSSINSSSIIEVGPFLPSFDRSLLHCFSAYNQ